jgi:hypothetical protein
MQGFRDVSSNLQITQEVSGGGQFSFGIDNADNDYWKLSIGDTLGTNDAFIMRDNGLRSMPLHCTAAAYASVDYPNTLGGPTVAGGQLDLPGDTEIFDQNNNYVNPQLTAPVTGNYICGMIGTASNIDSTKTAYAINITDAGLVAIGGGHYISIRPYSAAPNKSTGEITYSGGFVIYPKTAGDIETVRFVMGYGSMNATVVGSSSPLKTAAFMGLFC